MLLLVVVVNVNDATGGNEDAASAASVSSSDAVTGIVEDALMCRCRQLNLLFEIN